MVGKGLVIKMKYNANMQIKAAERDHWSEFLSSKILQMVPSGDGVEKMEPSCTVDGHAN